MPLVAELTSSQDMGADVDDVEDALDNNCWAMKKRILADAKLYVY